MEFRHLAALAAVKEEGSFVDAAFELGYVQSAVSQQIAQLERIVGARLVDRKRGAADVSITDAGELLLRHFDQIRGELQVAQAKLDEVRSGEAGLLRIGAPDYAATRLMPTILRALTGRLPHVTIAMESGPEALLSEQLESGELDICFGRLPLTGGPFELEPLLEDPHVLVIPADWPLADAEGSVVLADLAELPMIETGDKVVEASIADLLGGAGDGIGYAASAEGSRSAQAMAAAGIGAAIVPRMALDLSLERVAALDLEDFPKRNVVLYWQPEAAKAPGIAAFIEAASRACGASRSRPSAEPVLAAA
jgi:molybdate transport repressor ModE-like protein